jgi:hypothetical protein
MLPSRKCEGVTRVQDGDDGEGIGQRRRKQCARRQKRLIGLGLWKLWGLARGTHVKHILHVRDAGGVENQRLIERGRALRAESKERCIGRIYTNAGQSVAAGGGGL